MSGLRAEARPAIPPGVHVLKTTDPRWPAFVFAVDDEGRLVGHTLCSARVVEEIAEEMRDLLRD